MQGLYYILPDTITEIGERAFFRKTSASNGNAKYGVRVVTFKNSSTGNIKQADGTSEYTTSQFNTAVTNIGKMSENGHSYNLSMKVEYQLK